MRVLYRRHGHRLIFGETVTTLTRLSERGEQFEAIVTDPPYASGGLHLGTKSQSTREKYIQSETKKTHHNFDGDARSQLGWMTWCSLWLNLCRGMLTPGAPVLMFCDWRQIGAAIAAMEAGGFVHRGVVPWDKKGGRPQPNGFRAQCEYIVVGSNGKRKGRDEDSVYLPGLFTHAAPPSQARRHQTQKPIELLVDLMRIVPAAGRVLDPFAGSGTTVHAAHQLGLKATAIEEQEPIATDAADWLRTAVA